MVLVNTIMHFYNAAVFVLLGIARILPEIGMTSKSNGCVTRNRRMHNRKKHKPPQP